MAVTLREVRETDLEVLFEHQRQPRANAMAAFPARDRNAFFEHWRTKVLAVDTYLKRIVLADGLRARRSAHAGSIRVLEKCAFVRIGRHHDDRGADTVGEFVYELT
ncbi:MAG: hypothetical protein KDE27_20295 [Planctomycetes bacterium]|nr:hypothetical protein [Planctomycetota bacterium]